MPFRSDKISYGLPHEEYPKQRIDVSLAKLTEELELTREPVAVTFLFTKEDYDAYPAEEIKAKAAYCVMVKNAAVRGKATKSTAAQHMCDGGTTALALEPTTEDIESGGAYFSYKLYSSRATARRLRSSIQSLHREPVHTYGVAIVPLSQCVRTPDVIILVIRPKQAMRLVQGYEYYTGVKPKMDIGAMQAMCSEVTVVPYVTGELNLSVMCPSTRMLCKWADSDMLAGIPFELFETIADGVICTHPDY